jgi:hypothetical protein
MTARKIFGIEPRRQRRRTDEIAEHHRQLPPLGLGGVCLRGGRGLVRLGPKRSGIAERSDRLEQFQAMPEGQPQLLQVRVTERRQHRGVDGVIAERLGVLLQPEPTQPQRDIHGALAARRATASGVP